MDPFLTGNVHAAKVKFGVLDPVPTPRFTCARVDMKIVAQ